MIKHLHLGKNYVIHVYKDVETVQNDRSRIYGTNAVKETHPEGSDRNTASPTESAVCESQGREHSGADCLSPAAEAEKFRI